jgi:hypothetical protein
LAQKALLQHVPILGVTKAYEDLALTLIPELKGSRQGRGQATPSIKATPKEISEIFSCDTVSHDAVEVSL